MTINLREILSLTLILALSVMTVAQTPRSPKSQPRSFDVIIKGGTVYDGTRGESAASPRKDYAPAIEMLTRFIEREMADKELSALSIALVDDQQIDCIIRQPCSSYRLLLLPQQQCLCLHNQSCIRQLP